MRRVVLCLTPLLLLLCSVAVAEDSKPKKWSAAHTGSIDWVFGFDKAADEAEWSGRPMMVFFTTTW